MINKEKIQCFLTLARTLSFTETANTLYVAQQSVSKTIAQIEKKLGTELFYRTRKEVRLTEAGEEFYRLLSVFIDDYEQIEKKYAKTAKSSLQTVTIGYMDWLNLGSPFTIGWSKARKEFPDLTIIPECRPTAQLIALFMSGALDIVISQKRLVQFSDEMEYIPLAKTQLELFVSPEHPLYSDAADAYSFRSELILASPFIGETSEQTQARVERELALVGLSGSRVKFMPNRDTMYAQAELGQGVIIASEMNQNNTLIHLPLDAEDELICIWRKDSKEKITRRLAEIWKEEFSKRS